MANKGRARIVALAGLLCAAFGGLGAQAQDLSFELIGGGAVGDDGPATFANLIGVGDLVFDGAGNLYIAEFRGNRIRKVSPGGTATTLVGGATGFGGDGGPASAARISHPRNMAFDADGNLYFSDAGNHRVRRIATDGTITTVAGNGGFVHAGDGGQALDAGIADPGGLAFDSAGNLYIADTTSHRVRKVTPAGVISTYAGTGVKGYAGDGGPATAAAFDQPMGIDFDVNDNLYIADTNNSAIRKVAPNGTITNFLSSPNSYPMDVEVGANGRVYSPDISACAVYSTPPGYGTLLVAGGGGCDYNGENVPSFSASVGEVEGIALDGAGNVYMADTTHDMVRRLTVSTNLVDTFAGNLADVVADSPAIGAPLGMGLGIAVNATGDIAFSDTSPRLRIMKIDSAGTIRRLAGNGLYDNTCILPCGNALAYSFLYPWGTAFGPDGKLYISDRGWNRIYRIEADGSLVVVAGASTSLVNDGQPATTAKVDPNGIAFDAAGNLYTAELQYHRVRKIDTAGIISTIAGLGIAGFSGDGGPGTSASVNAPNGIAVAADGTVYFNDNNNRRIRRIATNGTITTIAGNGGTGLSGDGGSAVAAETGVVYGMAVDASGVYFTSNGRIRRIAPDGTIDSIGGWSDYAMGLAIRNGKLYVTTQNGRVLRASLSGVATHKAAHDFNGDGKSDLFWRNTGTGANVIWNGANGATQIATVGVTTQAWTVAGQGDFDGDGKADVLWRNTATGANTIWRSGNNATQIAVTAVVLPWKVVAVGDFDNDGKDDVFWRNPQTGANTIWRSGNSATRIDVLGVTGLAWQVVGAGDFDADGASDILWRNTGTGANVVWRSGNGTTQLPVTGVTSQAWKVAGVGDFNLDAHADIVWRNTTTGANTIWLSGNNATQQSMTAVATQSWRVHGIGDFDGDGGADVFWRNTSTGANTVWRLGNASLPLTTLGVTLSWQVVPQENQP